jgi:hypothetical protein
MVTLGGVGPCYASLAFYFIAFSPSYKLCDNRPHWGKLVHQLPEVVNFAYILLFRRTISRWKGLSEEYTCCHHTVTLSLL